MFRKSMFVALGLMLTFALGCEKKEEAPAVDTSAASQAADDAHKDAEGTMDEMKKDAADAADDVKDKVEDAAEKVGDAADDVSDAVKDIKVPE